MRLTSVTRMHLPHGSLHSYVVRAAGPLGRALPVSFDQRRHVSEGPRPASWMAVAFRLPDGIDRDALGRAWMRVVARHGTLRTVFVADDPAAGVDPDRLALHEVELVADGWTPHPASSDAQLLTARAGDAAARPLRAGQEELCTPEELRMLLRRVLDDACTPFARPSHRLCVVEPAGGGAPTVVIGADHAHVDMLSWQVLVRDLTAAALAERDGVEREGVQHAGAEPAVSAAPPFAEHTAELAAMPPAPAEIAERWTRILAAEGGALPRFPLPLGDVSRPGPAHVEVRDVLDAARLERFDARAAAAGVRPIALAVSVLAAVTARLADGAPLRAVFPVHSRHERRWHDAVGWFITNAVLEAADPDPAACATAVREAVALGSYPLAPILAPYGGMPMRPGMFALSWLDARRLPVPADPAWEIQHVSAAVEVDGVMAWFTVTERGLQMRCRFPDTAVAAANVGRWLDAVVAGLRAAAS
jgi:mycolipenoyl-CoA---2-(long-chain-fatty acyl)-trehalose mycolipenoyltransferase / long-chain-acyl-CoA---trehalose acyltransferase